MGSKTVDFSEQRDSQGLIGSKKVDFRFFSGFWVKSWTMTPKLEILVAFPILIWVRFAENGVLGSGGSVLTVFGSVLTGFHRICRASGFWVGGGPRLAL